MQPEGTVGLSPEEQQRWARRLAQHVTAATRTLTRLFLVHSLPESLKVTITQHGGQWGHWGHGVTRSMGDVGDTGGTG